MKKLYSKFILAVITCSLVFGIGFTIFSDTINVMGTPLTNDSFDIDVEGVSIIKNVGAGDGNTIYILDNDDTIVLSIPDLKYPGANISFLITVKNIGACNAIIDDIISYNSDDEIEVSYDIIKVGNIIKVNEITSFIVNIKWNEDSIATTANSNFKINILYKQYSNLEAVWKN